MARQKTACAWQLAILRFAVTLDNADRLAVTAIAREIAGLTHSTTERRISAFFVEPARSYAPLFSGRMSLPRPYCVNTLRELTMTASSAPSRQPLKLTNRRSLRSANLSSATATCREGFPRGATNSSDAWLRRTLGTAARNHLPPADARSRKCFSRHFGPGPRM
jgi:hypothetical protein